MSDDAPRDESHKPKPLRQKAFEPTKDENTIQLNPLIIDTDYDYIDPQRDYEE